MQEGHAGQRAGADPAARQPIDTGIELGVVAALGRPARERRSGQAALGRRPDAGSRRRQPFAAGDRQMSLDVDQLEGRTIGRVDQVQRATGDPPHDGLGVVPLAERLLELGSCPHAVLASSDPCTPAGLLARSYRHGVGGA